MNYADIYQPTKKTPYWIYNTLLIGSSSWLIALSAQLHLPIPFSPVPITAQTLAVLLLAAFLGKKRALAAVSAYILQGSLGLPVFAGGKSGLAVLLGPTGGYIWGFAAAAFVVGYLIEIGWDKKIMKAFLAMLLGNGLIYLSGLAWLAEYIPLELLLETGFYPFLAGDLIKILIAVIILSTTGKIKDALTSKYETIGSNFPTY
jgi:biotin transport system substrate-specific component